MFGLGTIINAAAILAAGLVGIFAGKLLNEKIQKTVSVAMGLSVAAMSLLGMAAKAISVDGGRLVAHGTYTIIFSLALGGFFGEFLDIEGRLERFGEWLKDKSGSQNDGAFVDGFVTASLTVCVGAMAIVGSIMDGIHGDHSVLITKSILDFVIIFAMSAAKGKGCLFSAIPVFVLQGSVTLLSRCVSPILTDAALDNLSLVGSILIFCVGVNLIADSKFRIKVANFLPALLLAVAAAFIPLEAFHN